MAKGQPLPPGSPLQLRGLQRAGHSSNWAIARSLCQGRRDIRPRGVDAQRLCPLKCQGEMSSRWIAMLADYDTSYVVRARAMGGLSACMCFLTVSLCMPSSRAIPRMDSPLRFAFCTAFHLAV